MFVEDLTLKCEALLTDSAPQSDTDVEVLSQRLHLTSVRTVSVFLKVSLSHPVCTITVFFYGYRRHVHI